jgi:hypothetical protein
VVEKERGGYQGLRRSSPGIWTPCRGAPPDHSRLPSTWHSFWLSCRRFWRLSISLCFLPSRQRNVLCAWVWTSVPDAHAARYVPGAITSLLVVIPYGLLLFARLMSEGIVGWTGLSGYCVLGAILFLPFVVTMLKLGGLLYAGAARLSRLNSGIPRRER